jgi:hypothetical protein
VASQYKRCQTAGAGVKSFIISNAYRGVSIGISKPGLRKGNALTTSTKMDQSAWHTLVWNSVRAFTQESASL